MTKQFIRVLAGGLLLLPGLAFAHPGHDASTFAQGFMHPIGGLDHLLAMLAVGVLASRYQGVARLLFPFVFVASMAVGAALSSIMSLPLVESMIALSLLTFGIAIVRTRTLPVSIGVSAVSLFALFHGHAHGSEADGALIAFSAGFVLSTALLHGAGLWLTLRLQQSDKYANAAIRIGGGIVAGTGVALVGLALA